MTAFVAQHTDGTSSASSTSWTAATLTASVAAGNLLVLSVSFDNTFTGTPTVTGITSLDAGAWTQLVHADAPTSTAGTSTRTEMWAIRTSSMWGSGGTITVTLSAAVAAKVGTLLEFSGTGDPATAGVGHASAGTNYGAATGTTPSVTGGSCIAGDLVVSTIAIDYGGVTWTADTTNTTGGAWAGNYTTNTATTGASGASQFTAYKILTAGTTPTHAITSSVTYLGGQSGTGVIAAVSAGTGATANPIVMVV